MGTKKKMDKDLFLFVKFAVITLWCWLWLGIFHPCLIEYSWNISHLFSHRCSYFFHTLPHIPSLQTFLRIFIKQQNLWGEKCWRWKHLTDCPNTKYTLGKWMVQRKPSCPKHLHSLSSYASPRENKIVKWVCFNLI